MIVAGVPLDTRGWPNGWHDVRVRMTEDAGRVTWSAVVRLYFKNPDGVVLQLS